MRPAPRTSTWPTSWSPCPRTPARRRSPSCGPRPSALQRARARRRGLRQARPRELRRRRRRRQRRGGGPAHAPTGIRRCSSQAVQAVPEGGVSDVGAFRCRLPRDQGDREAPRRAARRHVVQTHARHILLRTRRAAERERGAAAAGRIQEADRGRHRPISRSWRASTRRTAAPRNGGDLGWAAPGMFVPEFEEAMNRLAPGPDRRSADVALRRAPDPAAGAP